MISFERMNHKEYLDYLAFMLPDYIQDTAEHYVMTYDQAKEKADTQMQNLLPDDEKTEGQYLYHIMYDQQLAGYLWFNVRKEEEQAFLYHIFVLDSFRKRGIAQAALTFFEEESKKLGAKALGLHVFGTNENAIALYKKTGYKQASLSMMKVL